MGQHPLVSRLLKGAFNRRPPAPRYEFTWDVSQVVESIGSLGENKLLSLKLLTWKLTMVLSFTRPCKSSDLTLLDQHYRRYTPEAVIFQRVGLSKQSRQSHVEEDFFLSQIFSKHFTVPSEYPKGV
jgi:hypothetical protein